MAATPNCRPPRSEKPLREVVVPSLHLVMRHVKLSFPRLVLRTPKTHESNTRCVMHLTKAFGDAKVFKKYSQMKLQMKREALQRLNRTANESAGVLGQAG